ncbi:hypothetical protein Tco_0664051 [Tanacetum coccineum]
MSNGHLSPLGLFQSSLFVKDLKHSSIVYSNSALLLRSKLGEVNRSSHEYVECEMFFFYSQKIIDHCYSGSLLITWTIYHSGSGVGGLEDSRTSVVTSGASVVIGGVGIGVGVCYTYTSVEITGGGGGAVVTGVSDGISGIGGRVVVSRITDTGTLSAGGD